MAGHDPHSTHRLTRWHDGGAVAGERCVPEEVPVALTYGRATHAVMMATPLDLADFGMGFSLTEGIIRSPDDMAEMEVLPGPRGIELRMTLADERQEALQHRRRHMAGPVGCGLCGLDSLEATLRPLPLLPPSGRITPAEIRQALLGLSENQALQHATHAVHAAGFWQFDRLALLREDVGRHNALDKLGGALIRNSIDPGAGAAVLTSRVSVEMVQKTAMLGIGILIAVSAPTALAVRQAEACGLTLIARARDASFEVYSHGERVIGLVR
ncbi:formate dehydrogenase accessory sulfurtransferase FdhD [Pseudoroseomonas globiformis]|uniref:Sulfur carrier protein FdhD n=1 Tax=Teichococcus globiformis TaxID=2307229 RepID=A0ABV7GAH8_9PROT